MDQRPIEAVIAERFGLPRVPTFVAKVGASKLPIVFTHLRSFDSQHRRTGEVPREQSYSFQVPLVSFPWQAWFNGREKVVVSPSLPGNIYLFDLCTNPTVALWTPFSTIRINISQSVLDALANEHGLRKAAGLRAPGLGHPDPVIHGLSQTLAAAMERPHEATSLFIEYVALAFHAHVLHTYGEVHVAPLLKRGSLEHWQVRRARDFIEANLDGDPSIAAIAAECGLSTSYFARAFRRATGLPPHTWLLMRRIERAKVLMNGTDLDLAKIAVACGFVDQSHFSRIFAKRMGISPGRWRRLHRR